MNTTKQNIKIMGIINTTPDSFSGDGVYLQDNSISMATEHATQLVKDGATILDIGGESTRPNASFVDIDTEISRVIPVIEGIRKIHPDIPISIDTYKSDVAKVALQSGANIINDVWAGTKDKNMFSVAKSYDCPICLMHNSTTIGAVENTATGTSYTAPIKGDFMQTLLHELQMLANNAIQQGISPENIILDGGVGFGKTVSQNLQIIKHTPQIKTLGYPVLLGTSRKSFIGEVLNTPVEDRMIGTCATTALAVAYGVDIIRVHDVKQNAQTVQIAQHILGA